MNQHTDSSPLTPEIELERYEFFEEPRYQFDLDRRDFLKLVGGGIAICLVLGESLAQQPGRAGGRGSGGNVPQALGAGLHISETGQVTAYTGKVELGQNIRTSLSQVVAEELRLPVSAVLLEIISKPESLGTWEV